MKKFIVKLGKNLLLQIISIFILMGFVAFAVSFPSTTPSGETAGGKFQENFNKIWGAITINNVNNIGISNSNPTVKLDVNGQIKSNNKISSPEICLNGVCKTEWPTGGGYVPGTRTITTSDYFTVPVGVTTINIELWGGGGGSGFGANGRNYKGYWTYTSGGGGGSGGYTKKYGFSVIPGKKYYIYVGNGGYGGSKPTNNQYSTIGGTGNSTIIYDDSGNIILSANGGNGGVSHDWICNGGSCNGNVYCMNSTPASGAIATTYAGATNTPGKNGSGCVTGQTTVNGGLSSSNDHNGVIGYGKGGNGSNTSSKPGDNGAAIIWW